MRIIVKQKEGCVVASAAGDCSTCSNEGFVKNDAGDWISCPDCTPLMHEAERIGKVGIPGRYANSTFSTFQPGRQPKAAVQKALKAAKRACMDFAADPQGWVILGGPVGTGKTHLMVATAREYLHRGGTARYLSLNQVFARLRTSDGVAHDRVNILYRDAAAEGLLILDELGSGRTPFEIEVTSRVLQIRYNTGLPMMAASNFMIACEPNGEPLRKDEKDKATLGWRLDPTAFSRCLEAAYHKMPGVDARLLNRKEQPHVAHTPSRVADRDEAHVGGDG